MVVDGSADSRAIAHAGSLRRPGGASIVRREGQHVAASQAVSVVMVSLGGGVGESWDVVSSLSSE